MSGIDPGLRRALDELCADHGLVPLDDVLADPGRYVYDPPPDADEPAEELAPCCGLPVPYVNDPEHGPTCDVCLRRAVADTELT